MKPIKCLIVDDEPIAREVLKLHVERLPELQLVKECRNAAEATEALYEHEIDLMLLDIRMPVITGMEFLRSLRHPPLVVFTTAYSDHAVEGFELNSVDYLLKPVSFERFYQAVQRVRERLQIQTRPAPVQSDHFFLRQNLKLIKVSFADIDYVQAERDFCSLFMNNGKRLLAGMQLKTFEDILPPELFMRVHRSYIVRLSAINAINGNSLEIGTTAIPVGNSYRDAFFHRIKTG
jgi:DNA-binding LytR/AlgR family response regulator